MDSCIDPYNEHSIRKATKKVNEIIRSRCDWLNHGEPLCQKCYMKLKDPQSELPMNPDSLNEKYDTTVNTDSLGTDSSAAGKGSTYIL
jgi:hypothetical protein